MSEGVESIVNSLRGRKFTPADSEKLIREIRVRTVNDPDKAEGVGE